MCFRSLFRIQIVSLFGLVVWYGTAGGSSEFPIGLYDLRYTLNIDTADPQQVNRAWDHCHALSTLQGVVNREHPLLYYLYVDSQIKHKQNIDRYWLDKNTQPGKWLHGREQVPYSSIKELVSAYKKYIQGLVVYDSNIPATSNVASAVAGADRLIAVRYDSTSNSLYNELKAMLPVKVWLMRREGTSMFTGRGTIPGTEIPSTGSAKCDAYFWMKHRYMDTGKLNCAYAGYYIDYFWTTKPRATVLNHHTLTNHDFVVSQGGFFFDLSPWADEPATDDPDQRPGLDRDVMKQLFLSAYTQTQGQKMIHINGFPPWAFKYTQHAGGRHGDVPSEWEYTTLISAYNAFQDADAIGFGAIANASFWQHFPLQDSYPQPWVTRDDLKKRGYLTDEGRVDLQGRKFIVFYVGDYDSSAWIYQRIMDLWDSPDRGKVPMMWAVSPVTDRRVPMALHYMRKTASPLDYFVASDNGAGYLNPGMLEYPWNKKLRPLSNLPSGMNTWRDHCRGYYKKWGLTITGFVIDGYAEGMRQRGLDCYQSFSPNGLVWQKGAVSLLYKDMPILRADYDITQNDPAKAADLIIARSKLWPLPFQWFRNILKSPTWYVNVVAELAKKAPEIELLDAPTFFELYRIYLENHPEAAEGRYPQFMFFW